MNFAVAFAFAFEVVVEDCFAMREGAETVRVGLDEGFVFAEVKVEVEALEMGRGGLNGLGGIAVDFVLL